jgi:pSer/pThr/pTyr-binding forkhead associated (FHA) protein
VPGVPAPAAPAARPVATTYLLTLDDGRWTEVRGPGVVGRSPQVPTGEPCDHVVTIDDSTRSVSRTHARFGVGRSGFWVQDAGSGNGTIVVLPDGRALVAPPDTRTPVPVGATVRLGDRTFTVTEVHGAR